MKRAVSAILWITRLAAAVILIQAFYLKLSGQPESIYISNRLGLVPAARISMGIMELVAAILILIPITSWLGACIGLCTMLIAIGVHLTVIGLDVLGDGRRLFYLNCFVASSCSIILWLTRVQWIRLIRRQHLG